MNKFQIFFTLAILLFAGIMAGNADSRDKCMPDAIYHEGRSQSFKGQIAIGNVIKNRAKRKHKSVCEITHEHKQFSYLNHGALLVDDKKAYELAEKAAAASYDVTGGAVFYNTVKQGVKWGGHHPVVIDGHVFYRGKV